MKPTSPAELRKPILPGRGATDYERYLRTDELLELQKPKEKLVHPDEMTFQVVHQSSEILMKGLVFDLERARQHLEDADFANASRLLRRANMMLDHPIQLLRVLETLTPYDYHVIRAGLGHGSGLDSPGFLAILHIGPRLGEAFFHQLKLVGLTVEQMYRRHAEFFALHDLAEQLLDFDVRVQSFRFQHMKLAQRIIGGGVIGTAGTPVELLRQRQEYHFYKELWDVRNQITEIVNAARDTETSGHGEEKKSSY